MKRRSKNENAVSKEQGASNPDERSFEKVIKAVSKEVDLIAVQVNSRQFKQLMKYSAKRSFWLRLKNMRVDADGDINFKAIEIEEK